MLQKRRETIFAIEIFGSLYQYRLVFENLNYQKAPKPKTRVGAKQQQTDAALFNELANNGDIQIEKDIKQFFRNKQLYDLQHYDLNQIKIDALKNEVDINATPTERAVFNIYAHNNEMLMSNFAVRVAQDIYQKVCPSGVMLKDKQIKDLFQQFLRKRTEDMYSDISQYQIMIPIDPKD